MKFKIATTKPVIECQNKKIYFKDKFMFFVPFTFSSIYNGNQGHFHNKYEQGS